VGSSPSARTDFRHEHAPNVLLLVLLGFAERRAAEARERAAQAGLSAARSIEESARQHERIARVQDVTVEQGVSDADVHKQSAIRHREAAAVDRRVAERRRKEFEAGLSPGTDG
jgi:hypothetical protein